MAVPNMPGAVSSAGLPNGVAIRSATSRRPSREFGGSRRPPRRINASVATAAPC
jgi:hypothetical protein